ncbi:MAG: IPT/TIG domain-containing protein [Planctomycetota bacterium]
MNARVLAAAAVLLGSAGCGGGGTTFTSVNTGGVGGTGGASVEWRTAAVSVDLDEDGRADLAALARDGSGAARCWRGTADGLVPAPAAWAGADALAALLDDVDAFDDRGLLEGFGVHRLPRVGRSPLAYAVLHVGDAVDDPAVLPTIDALRPASGAAHDLVVVEGDGLAARGVATTATVGGTAATVVLALADAVVLVVPEGLPVGPAELRVTRGTATSGPATFEVLAPAVPVVTSLSPSVATPDTVLVLHGEHLGTPPERVEVTFSGAAPVRALGLGRGAAVVVPATAVSGPATIAVGGLSSAPFDVVVGDVPAPTLTTLVPAAASAGSLVRIEGDDLLVPGDRLEVTFGGVRAAIFALAPGAITAIVPAGATDGDVVVDVGGRARAGLAFDVVPRAAPVVTALVPGDLAVGDVLDVEGHDLVDLSGWRPGGLPPFPLFGDLRVTVGGKDAWFVVPTVEGLRLRVPSGAASGDVVVTVNRVASAPAPITIR